MADHRLLNIISGWKSLQADGYTDILEDVGPANTPGLNALQEMQAKALINQVGQFGQFSHDVVDGCGYLDTSPYAADGVNCSACVFYEGGGTCSIVDGQVDPMGVCRFYVVPEVEDQD